MISVNGKEYPFENLTLVELINQLKLDEKRIVVEVNYNIVPQNNYDNYHIKNGDTVEIVQFVGGG